MMKQVIKTDKLSALVLHFTSKFSLVGSFRTKSENFGFTKYKRAADIFMFLSTTD